MLLDDRRIEVLNYLLDYRSMNAKQMTSLIYMTLHYTVSNLKQVQRELRELKDKGLVSTFLYSEPLIDDEGIYKTQKVSMYFLTSKGYQYILDYFDVIPGQQGLGYFLTDNFQYGDIPYEVQKPPTCLIEHHLMATNAFVQLCMYGNKFPHRNNLYAAKKFGDNNRLRPDAEVVVNNKNYFLEFDRNTENHEKLVEKFLNYSGYFDTLSDVELKRQGKIIFVMSKGKGIKRRWNSLLAAYFKGLGRYCYNIELILCVEDELTTILTMESEINTFYSEHSSYLKALDSAEGIMHLANKIVLYKNKKNNLIKFSILIHDYDSSLITYFGACLKYINKSLEYVLDQNILLVKKDIEFEWKLNLSHYHVQDEFIEVYDELSKMNISTVPYRKIVLGEYDSQGNILKNIYDIYSEI